MAGFALTGATVLSGPNLNADTDSWIEVGEDGRISALGVGTHDRPVATRLDASGMIICPAFLNAHTHVIDGFLKEVGFGMPYWEVFMPPDGLRHQALAATVPEVIEDQLGRTLDQMIAVGTSVFADFREGGRAGVDLLERVASERLIQPMTLGRFSAYPPQSPDALTANRDKLDAEALDEITSIVNGGAGFSLIGAMT